MHQASHIGANRSEWHDPDIRRSIDFHAVLLATAGHDLRQHLQIILNSYGWLSARATNNPERERARGQHAVMQMAEQLHQLVTALHIHQKTSQIAMVPVRLGRLFSIVGQETSKFAAERGVQLRVVPTRAMVASDPVLLRSVIGNLARNAVKYTASGGKVLLGCRRFGTVVRIEVHDTGVGIPSERLHKIFEAFSRLEPTQSEGLGLGLFVVSRAAELLRHKIEVRSTVGRGSCIAVLANAADPRPALQGET
jgi:two-component system, OmpR family, phosphate regulon sensor histidine kinase PhoR